MSQHRYYSFNCRDIKFHWAHELNGDQTVKHGLLLVQGHWSYYRICILLCYFLYKTTAFALVRSIEKFMKVPQGHVQAQTGAQRFATFSGLNDMFPGNGVQRV
ncbi:putative phospholipid-transporting ATPase IM [Anabarilius grahami]|uniref:Putative phospholipid-transporting ATPase IM n=1 Tax=Anabarilius grahami TaxID=495550 RepID=A0A3N0Y3V9_ANAGA|nr:putative phospholipid-transporting ATPase IM [Anabarilius grahami]